MILTLISFLCGFGIFLAFNSVILTIGYTCKKYGWLGAQKNDPAWLVGVTSLGMLFIFACMAAVACFLISLLGEVVLDKLS